MVGDEILFENWVFVCVVCFVLYVWEVVCWSWRGIGCGVGVLRVVVVGVVVYVGVVVCFLGCLEGLGGLEGWGKWVVNGGRVFVYGVYEWGGVDRGVLIVYGFSMVSWGVMG